MTRGGSTPRHLYHLPPHRASYAADGNSPTMAPPQQTFLTTRKPKIQVSSKVKQVQTNFGSPGGLMRDCVCAIVDKGAAAGLESSEALGLAGAGPGGGECSPQVVRLGPSRQARVLAGWHSLLLPLEPSLALLADVRLLQGPSRGSRSNWDPGGRRRRRRLDCNNGPAATCHIPHTHTCFNMRQ
jgi:hypothetical protein